MQIQSQTSSNNKPTKIGNTTSFIVELRSLRDGLMLSLNRKFTVVEVELDRCQSISRNFIFSPILDDCRQLASMFAQIQFKHCFKEADRCGDRLARIGTLQDRDFILYESPFVDQRGWLLLFSLIDKYFIKHINIVNYH